MDKEENGPRVEPWEMVDGEVIAYRIEGTIYRRQETNDKEPREEENPIHVPFRRIRLWDATKPKT